MVAIVVPLDGSKLSEAALPYVEELAKQTRAEVYLIQVMDTRPATVDTFAIPRTLEEDFEDAAKYLSGLATAWQAEGLDVKWEVLQGAPAATIIRFAKSCGAFMIAMSTHGRSGISRMVFGSVADQVMRQVGIPVLMIRPLESAK